jgi:hypothetical protein
MHAAIAELCVSTVSAVAPQAAVTPQPVPWLDVVKTVATALALPLAAFTFWLGYRQKERERTRSYYHKVVVDVVLPGILDFFQAQAEAMTEAGRQAQLGLKSSRKTMPRSCSIALSNFSTGLYSLLDAITQRTLIFDEKVTAEIRNDVEDIEDAVTDWFNDAGLHKRRDVEEIRPLVQRGQRLLIKRLYKGEFRDF